MYGWLKELLNQAIDKLKSNGEYPAESMPNIMIESAKNSQHGDCATNLALVSAKLCKKNPLILAEQIVEYLNQQNHPNIVKIVIAKPGFINFFLNSAVKYQIINDVLSAGAEYGRNNCGDQRKILVEFVSANPTGPLHVGHGRHAAYGDSLANLLEFSGFIVEREYYVNDAGRQIDILALSVWFRYLKLLDNNISYSFPVKAYQGDYVVAIAKQLLVEYRDKFYVNLSEIINSITVDESADPEQYLDQLISAVKNNLSNDGFLLVCQESLKTVLDEIKDDLADFGINFDRWFSERSVLTSGAVERTLQQLSAANYLYERDDAVWFRSGDLGDEKDRVLIRSNGEYTYFLTDIAYHLNKLERDYDVLIDVWGADHHGYVARVKASLQALGHPHQLLTIKLVQFVHLYRGDQKMQMSTRSGEFITLRRLYEEIGQDAARFFYVMRKLDQTMDFDLELAKSKTQKNPIYYIQYAHARICSVLAKAEQQNNGWNKNLGVANLQMLTEPDELALINLLSAYSSCIRSSALEFAPHKLVQYLQQLAGDFHHYYNAYEFLTNDTMVRNARLTLYVAIKQIIANSLNLLGVSAPQQM